MNHQKVPTMRVIATPRSCRSMGFTLMEIMISVTIGAVLVTALAAMAGMFGSQVNAVVADIDRTLEEGLSTVGLAVQEAWVVEKSADTRLDVYDAVGGVTSYWLDGTTLKITRPSGAEGVLMTGVEDVVFDVGTVARLRDADPIDSYGDVWARRLDEAEALSLDILGGAGFTEESVPYYDPQATPGCWPTETRSRWASRCGPRRRMTWRRSRACPKRSRA